MSAIAQDKVIIGHFGTPLPFHAAVIGGDFEKATGWKIEWRKFGSGTEVIAAMASGDIKLAELGSSPLAIAASQGVDLQLFAVSDAIGAAEALIVRNGSGVNTVKDLKGKKVGVPLGSTAHYSLMGALEGAGLSSRDVKVIGMSPDQIVAAWNQGQIDATFVWEPAKGKAMKSGKQILHAGEVPGKATYDGWVVNREWGAKNGAFMAAFLKVLEKANAAYTSNPKAATADSAMIKAIAKSTGAPAAEIPDALTGYAFPSLKEMAGANWLGGGAVKNMAATAAFLKANKKIDSVASDYGKFVNASYLEAAMK
ncbi:MAG: taurine ABC transporter substrate-binding protein [Burkholderiaceae bacterium]|nr:taurine ABC transporter substrate-binding protein [Burkholderiaceae bacterium]